MFCFICLPWLLLQWMGLAELAEVARPCNNKLLFCGALRRRGVLGLQGITGDLTLVLLHTTGGKASQCHRQWGQQCTACSLLACDSGPGVQARLGCFYLFWLYFKVDFSLQPLKRRHRLPFVGRPGRAQGRLGFTNVSLAVIVHCLWRGKHMRPAFAPSIRHARKSARRCFYRALSQWVANSAG